ncbi:hypothetical protein DVH24_020719 [Malus domestica]|uniref:Uncharacterized protein n=1 Tax=Malus domestica TaxID=3750 RepID=A0A498J969_MALDO|nr:hypothetical protein DVH24_020719 [Malus domestica]
MKAGLTHFLFRGSEMKKEEKAECITRTRGWLLHYRFHRNVYCKVIQTCLKSSVEVRTIFLRKMLSND